MAAETAAPGFVNFETAPVHPLDLSPDRSQLLACQLAAARLAVIDVTGSTPVVVGSVPVGLDPVSVRFRTATEAWVVNHISDSISIVDVPSRRVVATLDTLDSPTDVVFAGTPRRAFVSCSLPNTIQVFDPQSRQLITNLMLAADRPRALATSPDGERVYAAFFESGNATTVVGARTRNFLFIDNAVSRTNGPYAGVNPPPNSGTTFDPPLNSTLPTNLPPPNTGVIVRRNEAGRWLDGNQRDWTEFVSGTNAPLTQRVPGWNLPDRDLAIIDASTFATSYANGLMNICMAVAPNPASGHIAVAGTEAMNEVRFEPNLNGVFVQVKLAMVDPLALTKIVRDLNPHLESTTPTGNAGLRQLSVGDPRSIVWTADGSRGYVAGMGSRNVVMIDSNGARLPSKPIEVGEGPCGLALDETRNRLYVFHRFATSISVIDPGANTVTDVVRLLDPTPPFINAGRRHLYDTRRTSGLGQVSCASCHVDARMDRLAWDLGNPAGAHASAVLNHQGTLVTNTFHPMKGVMVTQTLQDIIGHEPFHWRGDRADIEAFNGTFTNLQAAPAALSPAEMREFKTLLASVRFPPNPFRQLNNTLATNVPLPGHFATGDDQLPAGTPLPDGNAARGHDKFKLAESFCLTCHTLPTGLGFDNALQDGVMKPVVPGPNGGRLFPHSFRLENNLRSKIAQFRNMADKVGMDVTHTESRAGFGFGHDGSVDSLARFLNGLRIVRDQDVADITAFLLSIAGSDTLTPGAEPDSTPPAGAGRQITLSSSNRPPTLEMMLVLASSPTNRIDLIAKTGTGRGWFYDRARGLFQSDRRLESHPLETLLASVAPGNELTFTLVPAGLGWRLGVDQDADGVLDRDELDSNRDPATLAPLVTIDAQADAVAYGSPLELHAIIGGLPGPLNGLQWFRDGQPISGATNVDFELPGANFTDTGEYSVAISTPFTTHTSEAKRITTVPLLAEIIPATQQVRRGSNAVLTVSAKGIGPFSYQWRHDGLPLPSANTTSATLLITNAQLAADGIYDVVVSNAFGSITSATATLTVLVNPAVLVPPLNQAVPVGGNATFSFVISGNPPPFGYALRRSSSTISNYTSDDATGFFTLNAVQPSNAGTYRIVVTNAANPTTGLTMPPVTLTVLNDTDRDGLPDDWELAHGLSIANALDATLDSDGDQLSNLDEYLAGTNPLDLLNVLRFERIAGLDGGAAALIQFQAASNTTYTIESRTLTGDSPWTRVADIPAFATVRLVNITNATGTNLSQIYRLATPRRP